MAAPTHYNALILGSGQAGTPLASHIASLRQSVCLIERTHIAGCCVNEGCTPTKTMVASGRIAYLARRAANYGVGVGGDVSIDMHKIRQRKRNIVDSFRGGSEKRLKNAGVNVLMGSAQFVGPKEVEVTLTHGGEVKRVTADQIFINVGCRPSTPEIQGLQSIEPSRVLDSTSIQELGEVPKHLVVIGGGVIGLEFGQLFRRLGASVSIIQRGPRLFSKREDPELAECMQDILREDGVDLLLNTAVASVSKSNDANLPITITTRGPDSTNRDIHASHLLIATGRTPNTDSLNPGAAGITTTPSGHIRVTPALATNVSGVYALGDVKGGPGFTHISYDDFRILRDNLFSASASSSESAPKTRSTDDRAAFVPSVTYTDPQYATVGLSLSALPSSKTYVTYSMPASWIARGLETEETRGMLKAIVDPETDKMVGFSAIAVEGGEIMSVVQMAMLGGLTWKDLRDGVFAHPAWSEALNNLWGGERKEVKGGRDA
ncbi:FAD/NAD(P)-binding domain-containing protein [Pyrenochaeta sp. DS3sAY3a]|nr:FAD/NAD(P)-binding domain-containing protein [Pyrenochaeta sp. DS3sAY3a]